MDRSPRIPDRLLQAVPFASTTPRSPDATEFAALLTLVRGLDAGRLAIGTGRDDVCVGTADDLAAACAAAGVEVVRVSWPAEAASWLRPATRMTTPLPDGWVVLDHLAGASQVLRRLAEQPGWRADRTIVWSTLRRPILLDLVGPDVLEGLRGTTADGGTWRVQGGHILDA